jgi:hypothetical protein
VVFFVAVLMAALVAIPVMASVSASDTACATSGVLGREGGALELLGVGQPSTPDNDAFTVIDAVGTTYSLGAVHNGQTATYATYTEIGDCPLAEK